MSNVLLVQGDAQHIPLANASVHCVVTSPPYYGLRSYGIGAEHGELGHEPVHDCLGWATGQDCGGACNICAMRQVFREVWRVLRDDGTLWLNMGDSYHSNPAKGGSGTFNGRNGYGEGYARGKLKTSPRSPRMRLRADLTPEQQIYVLEELAKAKRISAATQDERV